MSIYLEVKVKANSKSFKIEKKGEILYVSVSSPPHDGKANKELLKKLKNIFKCNVEIVKGFNSPKKLIKLDIDEQTFNALLGRVNDYY